MQKINDKLLNWASILDYNALEQAIQTATMPFVYPHLALMPDAHLGKGATVGSVIPTVGAIMPAAVGVDIGCGMMAVQTQFHGSDLDGRNLSLLHQQISRSIPLSAGNQNNKVTQMAAKRISHLEALPGIKQADAVGTDWRKQLGTLGSGNHFIEVSVDEDDSLWLFLHSGSRGVGNRLASGHVKAAQDYCAAKGVKLPNRDLAYLEEDTVEFDSYLEALFWAQQYALLNREEMMDRCERQLSEFLGDKVVPLDMIACHHNYTERATIGVMDVLLSRKGAINAEAGRMGLIPGSMGDLSYIVRGLGNRDSLWSAPHGAGRSHSRSAAKRLFTREDLNTRMEGVAWGESDAFLDEHPEAYKPIDQVMKDASDLVETVHTLRQRVNVKGS